MAEQRLHDLAVTPPVRCAVVTQLPEAVAAAVIKFVTGSLLDPPGDG